MKKYWAILLPLLVMTFHFLKRFHMVLAFEPAASDTLPRPGRLNVGRQSRARSLQTNAAFRCSRSLASTVEGMLDGGMEGWRQTIGQHEVMNISHVPCVRPFQLWRKCNRYITCRAKKKNKKKKKFLQQAMQTLLIRDECI